MEELDEELASMPGYTEPEVQEIEKASLKNLTDSEYGYIHQ